MEDTDTPLTRSPPSRMKASFMSALVHMLNELGWPEYFRQTPALCVLLEIPVNVENSRDQHMSIAGGKRVNKLREFVEDIFSFQTVVS